MSDRIEEIDSKKRRDAGLSAWAELLERIQARQMAPAGPAEESGCGGGSGLPRDTMVRQDPKVAAARRLKLQAIQANQANLQAEARRLQDTISVQNAKETKAAEAPTSAQKVPQPARAQEVSQQQARVHEARQEEQIQSQTQQVQVEAEQTRAEVAEAQLPLAANTPEASEKMIQLTSLAGVQDSGPASRDEVDEAALASSIEEAMQLMALKSGLGANPELAAKEYVLASELAGVKDTLSGSVYEEFRVAL